MDCKNISFIPNKMAASSNYQIAVPAIPLKIQAELNGNVSMANSMKVNLASLTHQPLLEYRAFS
jgi:hypothetical protein